MAKAAEAKSERVSVRMTPAAKRTLQQAASIANTSMTAFLLDSGLAAAFDTLVGHSVFELDDAQWAAFVKSLAPPKASSPRKHPPAR